MDWLQKHHQSKTEIWLRRFKKATGKPSISYDDLVECCLCFGWIDGVIKKYDEESNVQRITPRRKKKTFLSELNRQRVWKLQRLGLITPAGIEPIKDQIGSPDVALRPDHFPSNCAIDPYRPSLPDKEEHNPMPLLPIEAIRQHNSG